MSSISQKLPRLSLDPVSYERLRQQVLHRDGWRCQSCGTMSNLEVFCGAGRYVAPERWPIELQSYSMSADAT
jgi:hypothetical protein